MRIEPDNHAHVESPKVSYIVASYNHEAYIGDTLRSILAQTTSELEVIVVDDGSTDGTVGVAEAIAGKDGRLKVQVQEHQGVVEARNRGMTLARGEYVSLVDSDDLLPAERTLWMVEALDAHPEAALVYGDAWIIDESGRRLGRFFENYPPVGGDFSAELFATYCFVHAGSVMFRRSAFLQSGPFWGPGPNMDYLKWIELGLLGEVVCLRDKQLSCWRWHEKNASMPEGARRAAMYEKLREGLQELATRHTELARRIGDRRLRRRYSRCHFMGAFYAGLMNSWSDAREHFAKAYRFHPSVLNLAAWISALPGLNLLASPLYRLAHRAKLKVRP